MASDKQPLSSNDTAAAGPQRAGVMPQETLPARKTCSGYHVYKILSIIYAIIFVIIGLLLTGISIWVIFLKQEFQSINDIVLAPAILMVIIGCLIITTALIGCIGASCDHLWPLRIFLGIIILVFFLQVITGIVAYVHRQETIEKLGDELTFALQEYKNDEDVQKAVDKVQRRYKCCGIESSDDWNKNKLYDCKNTGSVHMCSVPDSCCTNERLDCGKGLRRQSANENQLNRRGCKVSFRNWVERNLDTIGATALAMAILHILGIFVVFMFITKVEDRIRLFKYRQRFYDN